MNSVESSQDDTLVLQAAQIQHALAKLAAKHQVVKTHDLQSALQAESASPGELPQGGSLLTLPKDHAPGDPCWVITLAPVDGSAPEIRIKVVGDAAMGVARQQDLSPDLDLGPYQAESKGVSRRHAILRPRADRLYLIPLQSTNGTRLNQTLLEVGTAVALHEGDVITLGALHLVVHILGGLPHCN